MSKITEDEGMQMAAEELRRQRLGKRSPFPTIFG